MLCWLVELSTIPWLQGPGPILLKPCWAPPAYIGDDFIDLSCLGRAVNAFCPADSVPEVLQQAPFVFKHGGKWRSPESLRF